MQPLTYRGISTEQHKQFLPVTERVLEARDSPGQIAAQSSFHMKKNWDNRRISRSTEILHYPPATGGHTATVSPPLRIGSSRSDSCLDVPLINTRWTWSRGIRCWSIRSFNEHDSGTSSAIAFRTAPAGKNSDNPAKSLKVIFMSPRQASTLNGSINPVANTMGCRHIGFHQLQRVF